MESNNIDRLRSLSLRDLIAEAVKETERSMFWFITGMISTHPETDEESSKKLWAIGHRLLGAPKDDHADAVKALKNIVPPIRSI